MNQIGASRDPRRPQQLKPKWDKVTHKNPRNFNLFLSPRSVAIQIGKSELFISSLKCCYVYNAEKHEFVSQHNFAFDDEFHDGFLLYGEKVYGYGRKGVHVFDVVLRKWSFVEDPIAKKL